MSVSSSTVRAAGPGDEAARYAAARTMLRGDGGWIVRAGYADIFVSRRGASESPGRRHHLFRAGERSIVFGLPESSDLLFEAIGTESTVLEPVGREWIDACANDPQAVAMTPRAVDRWIDNLCEYVAAGVPPANCASYTAGQEATVDAGGSVRSALGVTVVEVVSGEAAFCGYARARLQTGDLVSVSWRTWLTATAESTVRVKALGEVVSRGDLWRALDTLHELAVEAVRVRLEHIRQVERDRQGAKSVAAQAAGAGALGEIAAAFREAPAEAVAATFADGAATTQERLNAACRLIAERLRIPFAAPSTTEYRTLKDGVESVARASRFRARQVMLTDDWWRHDEGPLLGSWKDSQRPVALLPRKRSGYDAVDPHDRSRRPVTLQVAALLAPTAFTLYRPFRPGRVGVFELLRFGMAGCTREFATIVATGALAGVIATGVPIATGVLINSIIPSTDRLQLVQWTVLLLVGAAASGMIQVARSISLIRLEMRLAYAIQSAVWDRLISLPSGFFRQYAAGNLASRAMGLDSVRQTLSGATIRAVLGGVFSVFNFALLFFYDVRLALCAAVLVATAVLVFTGLAYFQRVQQREVAAIQAKTSGIILQLLTGIRKLRVAGAETRAFAIWARLFSTQRRAQLRIRGLANWLRVFTVSFPLVAYAALFTVILTTPGGGAIRTGDFLAFLAAFTGCIDATMMTATAAINALSVIPQYEMSRPILDAEPEVSAGQADPGPLNGDITCDKIVFRYRQEGPPILNGLSFKIKAGEFVAFVGPSGSGKSTVLRLLLGFENAESGAVYYDGRDFRDLDTRAVRRQIGVVLQSGRLMPGDIYTNIAGCSSASMDEAWAATRMAGLEDDIRRMPMGMHTMVTDGGGTLSGGQRQRLLIARAVVGAPRLLFFDEATSALDNQTQAIVSQSLERLRATRVVIAHRLSTIVNADRIFVVEKGIIVQSGTYDELMAQPGLFRELASRQLA
ncbi:MAG: NHLP bacteriocin export ABC transporter permease/ATPase subunit [Vicinamibacterales bacterium]